MLRFFSLTYLVTWTCFAVAIALSGSSPSFVPSFSVLRTPLLMLGTFAPSLVAFGLTARVEGVAGMQVLLRRAFEWPSAVRWYLFAVGYLIAIKLAVVVVHRLLVGAWPRFGTEPWYLIAVAIVISTPVQAGEEIGWRGYLLPRLQRTVSPAWASVLIGTRRCAVNPAIPSRTAAGAGAASRPSIHARTSSHSSQASADASGESKCG